jgi:hypothetical protein
LDLDLCFVCRGAIPAPQRKNQIMAGSFIVPSINVDSCIIEEQDDHLVLAIRVPRATIVSNMALLGALAECCGAVWSTRTDPPLRSNRRFSIGWFFRQMLR